MNNMNNNMNNSNFNNNIYNVKSKKSIIPSSSISSISISKLSKDLSISNNIETIIPSRKKTFDFIDNIKRKETKVVISPLATPIIMVESSGLKDHLRVFNRPLSPDNKSIEYYNNFEFKSSTRDSSSNSPNVFKENNNRPKTNQSPNRFNEKERITLIQRQSKKYNRPSTSIAHAMQSGLTIDDDIVRKPLSSYKIGNLTSDQNEQNQTLNSDLSLPTLFENHKPSITVSYGNVSPDYQLAKQNSPTFRPPNDILRPISAKKLRPTSAELVSSFRPPSAINNKNGPHSLNRSSSMQQTLNRIPSIRYNQSTSNIYDGLNYNLTPIKEDSTTISKGIFFTEFEENTRPNTVSMNKNASFKLSPSKIPPEDHVTDIAPVFGKDNRNFIQKQGKSQRQIFPSEQPNRNETTMLASWLERKVKKFDNNVKPFSFTRTKFNMYPSISAAPIINSSNINQGESVESLSKIHELSSIYYHELCRQVNVSCKEHSFMLSNIWKEYVNPLFELAKKSLSKVESSPDNSNNTNSELLDSKSISNLSFAFIEEDLHKSTVSLGDTIYDDIKYVDFQLQNEKTLDLKSLQLEVTRLQKNFAAYRSNVDKQISYHSNSILDEKQRDRELRRILIALESLKSSAGVELANSIEHVCIDLLILTSSRSSTVAAFNNNIKSNVSLYGCNGLLLDAINLLRISLFSKPNEIFSIINQAQACILKSLDFNNVRYILNDEHFELHAESKYNHDQLKIISKPTSLQFDIIASSNIIESRFAPLILKKDFLLKKTNGCIDSVFELLGNSLISGTSLSTNKLMNNNERDNITRQVLSLISDELVLPLEFYPIGVHQAYTRFITKRDVFFTDGLEWNLPFTNSFLNVFLEGTMKMYSRYQLLCQEIPLIHQSLYDFFLQINNTEDRACEKLVQFLVSVKKLSGQNPRLSTFAKFIGLIPSNFKQPTINFYFLLSSQICLVLKSNLFLKHNLILELDKTKQLFLNSLLPELSSNGLLLSSKITNKRLSNSFQLKKFIEETRNNIGDTLRDPIHLVDADVLSDFIDREANKTYVHPEKNVDGIVNSPISLLHRMTSNTTFSNSNTVSNNFNTILKEEFEKIFDEKNLLDKSILKISPGHLKKQLDIDILFSELLCGFSKALEIEENIIDDYYCSIIAPNTRFNLNNFSTVIQSSFPGIFTDVEISSFYRDISSGAISAPPTFLNTLKLLRSQKYIPLDSNYRLNNIEEISVNKMIENSLFERVYDLYMPSIIAKSTTFSTSFPKDFPQVEEKINFVTKMIENKQNTLQAWMSFRDLLETLEPSLSYLPQEN